MALIKRTDNDHPLERLFSDFFDGERFTGQGLSRFSQKEPMVNISETDREYKVEVAAPGMDKKDLNVSVEDNRLVISGEKKDEVNEEQDNYTRKEFSYSSFNRSFVLPETVNEDDIKANYKNGVLMLSIPKKDNGQPRKRKEISVS